MFSQSPSISSVTLIHRYIWAHSQTHTHRHTHVHTYIHMHTVCWLWSDKNQRPQNLRQKYKENYLEKLGCIFHIEPNTWCIVLVDISMLAKSYCGNVFLICMHNWITLVYIWNTTFFAEFNYTSIKEKPVLPRSLKLVRQHGTYTRGLRLGLHDEVILAQLTAACVQSSWSTGADRPGARSVGCLCKRQGVMAELLVPFAVTDPGEDTTGGWDLPRSTPYPAPWAS